MGATSPQRRPGGTPSYRSVGVPRTAAPCQPPRGLDAIDEFSLADSFVLGVLHGFRLLQSAGLSADKKRDILSTTKGSLEFTVITHALQTSWDEQLLGRAAGTSSLRSSMGGYFQESFSALEEPYDSCWNDGWDD